MMAKNKEKAIDVLSKLAVLFPGAECELVHRNAFELAVAVLLSAQATDVSVNKITPALFERFPTPYDMAKSSQQEIEGYIKSIGLYRNKAKSLYLLANTLVDNFQGEIPKDFDALVSLPGIGMKSANVILSVWFKVPALAVDTHVERVSKRLQFCKMSDSVLEVEKKLCRYIPKDQWNSAHHSFIFFGRYLCKAMKPECERCPLQEYCIVIKEKRKLEERERKKKVRAAMKQLQKNANK